MRVTINNITDEKINRAMRAIRENGGAVEGNFFIVSGVKGSYTRNGTSATINISSKPWYIPETVIEDKINGFFS